MIDTYDKLIAGFNSNRMEPIYKASFANQIASLAGTSFWRSAGRPLQAAIPTAAETPNGGTLGSFKLPVHDPLTERMYLGELSITSTTTLSCRMADRLAHMGGLSGTDIGVQSVNLTLTGAVADERCDAAGTDVSWFTEHYVNTGGTARNLTVNYIDGNDDAQTTTVVYPATVRTGRLYPIIPTFAVGGSIKSITSVQLSGTTGAVGNFGITAFRPIAIINVTLANTGTSLDFAGLGMPRVFPNSCLTLFSFPATTTTQGPVYGTAKIIKG